MKFLPLLVPPALAALCPLVAQQPAGAKRETVKLALVGGASITGTVSGIEDRQVDLITDHGVIRVPAPNLTVDLRRNLGISADAHVARLEMRIAEPEALVERLEIEKPQLRRQQAAAIPGAAS